MAEGLDLKTVVKHLANGSLSDSICLVCLLPLTGDNFESIFTSICKKDEEFSIVDILRQVCQLKILDTEHYNICSNCFNCASAAYKFYLQANRSYEIINFYTNQLSSNIEDLHIQMQDNKRLLCIPLPVYKPETPSFDFGLEGIGSREIDMDENETNISDAVKNDVIIKDENAVSYSFHNGFLQEIESEGSDDENVLMIVNEKKRRKRIPMEYMSCMHCPVKYRFISKLKEHGKKMHNVDIYYCKVCKQITDSKEKYEEHLTTHIGEYQCMQCNSIYRRQRSLIEHMKFHDNYEKCREKTLENGNICEICGNILEDEASLEKHRLDRHVKRYTCYYCGKMYKARLSFELHIQKHEEYLKNEKKSESNSKEEKAESSESKDKEKRCICDVCSKTFVNERSLLWHQRLHDNDRPFTCDICSRGFVSLNRRNQHMSCAHARPSFRCPLCPALFHLRSMVNTHVKKVHLNKQKRRNRITKHTNVFWKTTIVPIQELSVSIQNEVLEMQSSLDRDSMDNSGTDITPKISIDDSKYINSRKRKNPSISYADLKEKLPADIMNQEQDLLDDSNLKLLKDE